jgi:predicted ATPase/class 3 adenylate cyclase
MAGRALPAGTVTLVVTDIDGSTRLLMALGEEAYGAALADHRRVIREAYTRHGGVEVDTQGDAFLLSFPSARGALTAAREVVDGLAHGPIQVRIGIHTGVPILTDDGYVGADLHRVARIAAAGHAGQVLVSAATRALIDSDGLEDLGEHRLKDLAAPERIYQVGDGKFPPLRSLHGTNLPVATTEFVGRVEELAAVTELILREDTRLVTLTGPGGAGKTRLALQAATDVSASFVDGTFWVPLAAVRDAGLVLSTVAASLGVKEVVDGDLERLVLGRLRGKRTLLVLDNVEHLLPDVAETVNSVVAIAGPTLVLTSRERLGLTAEHTWPVPPLSEPDGVALFLQRAGQVGAPSAPTPAVIELCARLDGLPLAIELAAARTTLFTPEQLLDRLAQRLDLLKAPRGTDPRHQTLRATIAWSYELLDEAERRLFERMSVFVGGASYEAAAEVAGAIPDVLQALIDKSLVRRRDAPSGPRYSLPATIREFAAERLELGGAATETRKPHARWFAELGAKGAGRARRREAEWITVLDDEQANMRVGVAESISTRDAATTATYLFALWYYWHVRGFGHEARTAATAWLAMDRDSLDPVRRYVGLLSAGEILRFAGDAGIARALKTEQTEIARAHPDLSLYEWRPSLPSTLADLSGINLRDGRVDEAEAQASEALAIRIALGDPGGIVHAEDALAAVLYARGDYVGSLGLLTTAAGRLRGITNQPVDLALIELGATAAEIGLGNLAAARARLGTISDQVRASRDPELFVGYIRVAALLAARDGDAETAAQLFAAVDRLVRDTGYADLALPPDRAALEGVRAALGKDAFERSQNLGESQTDAAVLALVAALLDERPDAGV